MNDNNLTSKRLQKLSQLMDSSIRLPGGYRIGWDGIIGLVPGIGDLAGLAISLYIIASARKLGVGRSTLVRMLLNVGIESVIGSVPIIGDLFDFAFKANNKNMRLISSHKIDPAGTTARSSVSLGLYMLATVLLVLFAAWFLLEILLKLIGLF